MNAQEISAWRFVELCLSLVVSEASSYFTLAPYFLKTSLTTFFFKPLAVHMRHFSCVAFTNQDWPNFVECCRLLFQSTDLHQHFLYIFREEESRVSTSYFLISLGKGKGKVVLLQAWGDPEGSRKLRFPDFVTPAQDDGKIVSLTHRPPLPPGNTPDTHFC